MLGDLSHVEKIYIRCGYTDNWILTAIPYSCSVERGLTGSKQSITRETVSAFYTNGTKTDVSNGRGPAKKQNRFLISSYAGFWKV